MKTTPVAHIQTDRLPGWLQWGVFAILALIVVLMPFHAFLSTWAGNVYGHIEIWKSWKEYLLVAVSVPLVGWLSLKPSRWKILFEDRLAWWIVAFVALLGGLTLLNHHFVATPAALAGLAIDGRYLLMFALAYTLFRFGTWGWTRLRRQLSTYVLAAGLLVSLLGIIQVHFLPNDFLSQFGYDKDKTIAPYILIDQNPDAPRAFATLRGPNDFAAFLILPLLISLYLARRDKRWCIATFVLLFAIFESASRSAWLGTLVAVAAFFFLTYGKAVWRSRKLRLGMTGVAVVAVLSIVAAVSIPAFRLEVFHSSPGDTSLTEGSTDAHWQATTNGVKRVLAYPFGCGAGCAGPASYYGDAPRISENYYVQIAEEAGVVGLGIWIGIAIIALRRVWRIRQDCLARDLIAAFIGISVIGLWLHVWADDPLSLTWWSIAGVTLGYYAQIGYDKQKHNGIPAAKTNKPNAKSKPKK